MKCDDIADRLLDFGVRVLRLTSAMPKSLASKHIGLQLLRSGTSAGANYEEARGAESRNDFIHKLGIAWKETRESRYWLRLVQKAEIIWPVRVTKLIDESEELSRILASSLRTAKSKKT